VVAALIQDSQVSSRIESYQWVGNVGSNPTGSANKTKQMALFKALMEKIDHAVTPLSMPNPLKRQEGGEHYKGYEIQPAEFIFTNNIPYLEGCALKYLCRHRQKGGVEDLMKAKHYIDIIIFMEYKNQI